MDMEKINEKLEKFAEMAIRDASEKAAVVINEAKNNNQKILEEKELAALKDAYRRIQDALLKIEKESNALYSAKLFEAKELLYKKRMEIMDSVFNRVAERLENYLKTPEYPKKLKNLIKEGLNEVGDGDVHVYVDSRDKAYANEVLNENKGGFVIEESIEPLSGGCLVMNKTNGLLADFSFSSRLKHQRQIFLEDSGMKIEM